MENTTEDPSACAFCPCRVQSPAKAAGRRLIRPSLTRLTADGSKVFESELNKPSRLRFHGWYDNELVTREGEDILEEIDTRAIRRLRELKLVWSGFDDDNALSDVISEAGYPLLRLLDLGDAADLRIFFLSLVWRAAASKRFEFHNIQLGDDILENLREKVVARSPGSIEEFPIQLFQIVTKGPRHNRGPIMEEKNLVIDDGVKLCEATYVRFYLDGLVAHVHLNFQSDTPLAFIASCLGGASRTFIFANEYENSRTHDNFLVIARQHEKHGS